MALGSRVRVLCWIPGCSRQSNHCSSFTCPVLGGSEVQRVTGTCIPPIEDARDEIYFRHLDWRIYYHKEKKKARIWRVFKGNDISLSLNDQVHSPCRITYLSIDKPLCALCDLHRAVPECEVFAKVILLSRVRLWLTKRFTAFWTDDRRNSQ